MAPPDAPSPEHDGSLGDALGALEASAAIPLGARPLRARVGAVVFRQAFEQLARAGRLHPMANPARHGVEVIREVAYTDSGARHHRLDIYRPTFRRGPLPAVLYIHGGAFTILSKETHWMMALAFARQGYVVFNINYRLAPQHRFPAAAHDSCAAAAWIARNGGAWGADLDRLIVAGESAGANLATAVAIATSYRRPEPWASELFDTGLRPRVALPACGVLQVSDPHRILRRYPQLNRWVGDRVIECATHYLPPGPCASDYGLADPLLILERGEPPDRPLPAFFAVAGTRDPLLDDTRRLGAALERLDTPHEVRLYPGGLHAFHALLWQEQARRSWRDTFDFLARHL